MARRIVDMEPAVALAGTLAALAEAGRYAGHGMRTTGKRAGRRARVVGTEAAYRTALAARVLSGRPPPRARGPRLGLVAVAAAAAGAVTAVAVRQSVIVLRARTTTGTAAPMREPAKVGVQAGDTGQDDSLETDRAGTGQLI